MQTGLLENTSPQICVLSFTFLDQSGSNAIHSSHVLSKLLGKSRGTHHSFSLTPQEVTSEKPDFLLSKLNDTHLTSAEKSDSTQVNTCAA